MSAFDPKQTQTGRLSRAAGVDFALDLGQSAFEFIGPKYSKR
jgi:hypothetical protein